MENFRRSRCQEVLVFLDAILSLNAVKRAHDLLTFAIDLELTISRLREPYGAKVASQLSF